MKKITERRGGQTSVIRGEEGKGWGEQSRKLQLIFNLGGKDVEKNDYKTWGVKGVA